MAHSVQTRATKRQISLSFGLAIGIGMFGGAIAGVMITFLEVLKGVAEGNPTAGEAGIYIWILPPLLALVGFPLGVAGRLVAFVIRLQVDGALPGAVFGMILGAVCAALTFPVFSYNGAPLSDYAIPMLGLVVSYPIAGALVVMRLLKKRASV